MLYSQHESIPFVNRSYPIRILKDVTLTEDDAKNITPKWHEEIELLYFYSGGAAAQIGEHEYISSDGDLIIINPLQIHDVYYHSGSPRYDCIMIDKSVYIGTLDKLCTSKYGSPMHEYDVHFNNIIRCKDELFSILQTFLRECRLEGLAGDDLEQNLLQCLFILLFRSELHGITQIREGRLAVSRYKRLENVFRYIYENYESKITTDELARLCSVTPTHFCKLFKDTTGKTASEYICEYRLSKARFLLDSTDLPIADIASMTGFEDNCYFSRRFKRLYGVSPMNYRTSKIAHLSPKI